MSSSIATRSATPVPAQPAVRWPARITILDLDGSRLSEATIRGEHTSERPGERVLLHDVAASDCLLAYYFGRAGRRIMLDLGTRTLDGSLGTRWDGDHRAWWVELGAS